MSENSAETSHDKDVKLGRLRIILAIKVFSLIWVAFVIWATVFPDYLPVTQVQSKVYLFIFGWWPLAGFLYFAAAKSD